MKKEETDYGVYFWLTLVTFVVPIFVAFYAFDKIAPTTKPVPQPDASGVDHQLWDYLLKSYIENGKVDYQGIQRDYVFKIYLRQLGGADVSQLKTRNEKLAFYCNAYNALVINGVINHQIRNSVEEFRVNDLGFFNQREHILGNRTVTLNELEHKVIRPTFNEPRVHFALVCAAVSCPAIRPEAYVGQRLDEQLEDQAELFANNQEHVYFDRQSKRVMLNSILKWYGEDWDSVGGYLEWLAQRVNSAELKSKLLDADQGLVEVGFIKYDWRLNGQESRSDGQYQRSDAGSGTIPNE